MGGTIVGAEHPRNRKGVGDIGFSIIRLANLPTGWSPDQVAAAPVTDRRMAMTDGSNP